MREAGAGSPGAADATSNQKPLHRIQASGTAKGTTPATTDTRLWDIAAAMRRRGWLFAASER
ncbi:hypothetical protein GCM10010336_66420 [Streptomyces goshikiensis]|nr:hypothetical protein GCM10010336_66420 [Streptomyces goshikiensis]